MSQSNIDEFCKRVIDAHNAHYINNPNGLIDVSTTSSPNGNQIYHLYSSGEITYQKGAWAYKQRSEFNSECDLNGARKLPFKFLHTAADNTTYVILSQEECRQFRQEMKQLIDSINAPRRPP